MSPTATSIGLKPEDIRKLALKNGCKYSEPLTEAAVNQLCALKAAGVQKRSMRKLRKK